MDSTWFRRLGGQPAGDAPRLVCFPHAGGAASAYRTLAMALAPDVEVLAVQYPGRQDRRAEQPVASITGLAEVVADRLAPETSRPYALFGHSMGAAVAYETARRLGGRGLPRPVRLFLSGRTAPSPRPGRGDRIPDDQEAIVAEIRRLGGTAGRVLHDPEMLEMVLPPLRSDYTALRGYTWEAGPPLDVPFTVLVGSGDPLVTRSEAARWLEHSTAPGEVLTFPGGHFYLEDGVRELADALEKGLGG